jgi:predicted ATP-grasp superfamily ATP-dependent carboligase
MDDISIITVLTALVTALGAKEIWNIWKKKIDHKSQKLTKDEITKDQLTANVIGELKDKIIELEIKIDKLITENLDLHKKLARMEERLVLNANKKSTRKRVKSSNGTK